jgi:glycine cleavage system transcriptional repressor
VLRRGGGLFWGGRINSLMHSSIEYAIVFYSFDTFSRNSDASLTPMIERPSGMPLSDLSNVYYVVTTVGKDASGLVAGMCEVITRHNGNIEDSTMTRLGGQFAMIYLICFQTDRQAEAFKTDAKTLRTTHGLHVEATPLSESEIQAQLSPEHAKTPAQRKYLLSVGGYDRTGITLAFSKALATLQVNITDLNAHRINGQEGVVYILAIEMECPASVDETTLTDALNALGKEMELDVRLRSMDALIL